LFGKNKGIMTVMERPKHRVSVKAALVTSDRSKVLVTKLADGRFGLPGGHLEYGETPDEGIVRELNEELGVAYRGPLTQAGFWADPSGDRILLGYIGQLDETTPLTLQYEELEGVHWATLSEVESGVVMTRTYNDLLIKALVHE
jgi:8-oxo-dGTP pyrophosphatase MutT (NUDIX family)